MTKKDKIVDNIPPATKAGGDVVVDLMTIADCLDYYDKIDIILRSTYKQLYKMSLTERHRLAPELRLLIARTAYLRKELQEVK